VIQAANQSWLLLDDATLLAVSVLFFGVATIAALGPARRASRIDVLQALRAE
jgi:ABC-type lipoprotein release transport system permease subunit